MVDYCIMSVFVVGLWLIHLDTEAITFFVFFLVTDSLKRCRCHVPSSAYFPAKKVFLDDS